MKIVTGDLLQHGSRPPWESRFPNYKSRLCSGANDGVVGDRGSGEGKAFPFGKIAIATSLEKSEKQLYNINVPPQKKPERAANTYIEDSGVKITAYHCRPVINGQFIIPAFFTTDKAGAEWYLTGRGDGNWSVAEATISFTKPFVIEDKDSAMAFIDIARKAGIAVTVDEDEYGWGFNSPEIEKHSPYDDVTNYLHLVYIPAMRAQLRKEGYDGVQAWDTLENTEIPVYIAISLDSIHPNV